MNHSNALRIALFTFLFLGLVGCSSSREVLTETSATASEAMATSDEMTETPPEESAPEAVVSEEDVLLRWFHQEGADGKYRGVDTDQAYMTLLKDKKASQTVVVAVIDSGIDIEHEDLKEVIWVNEDEIAGNGEDDDNNGYVDDTHGWNFIGSPDGEHVDFDTFEVTREFARLNEMYADVDVNTLPDAKKEEYAYYLEVVAAFEKEKTEMGELFANYEPAVQYVDLADRVMQSHFGKADYSIEEVKALSLEREDIKQAQSILVYFDSIGLTAEQLKRDFHEIDGRLNKGLNPEFDPRSIVGDNYEDLTEKGYGNNLVEGPDARHGTHVAGIIAAQRGNDIGMDGVANAVEIMPIRAVPNGDERDKDIANAIRYAVDNGARIINMSFGKDFSPHKAVVDDAVRYAVQNNVLLVHAAGNSGQNNDVSRNYPEPTVGEPAEPVATWIEVGASNWETADMLAASFSNYGKESVDLFAPGVAIYSTTPDDTYESIQGTSMAAPVVSGVAALLMAYYPALSAKEVKDILLESAVSYKGQSVILPGSEAEEIDFGMLSTTGAIVNAYNALKLAEERTSE